VLRLEVHFLKLVCSRNMPLCCGDDGQIKHLELVRRMRWGPHGKDPMHGAQAVQLGPAMGGAVVQDQVCGPVRGEPVPSGRKW
jgi:hypothetical protein